MALSQFASWSTSTVISACGGGNKIMASACGGNDRAVSSACGGGDK